MLTWLRCVLGRRECPMPVPGAEERARRIEQEHRRLQRELDRLQALMVRASIADRQREEARRDADAHR